MITRALFIALATLATQSAFAGLGKAADISVDDKNKLLSASESLITKSGTKENQEESARVLRNALKEHAPEIAKAFKGEDLTAIGGHLRSGRLQLAEVKGNVCMIFFKNSNGTYSSAWAYSWNEQLVVKSCLKFPGTEHVGTIHSLGDPIQ